MSTITKIKLEGRLALYKNLFSFFLLIYALSFFMPTTISPSSTSVQTLYGWEAAFWATVSMGDRLDYFIGGLANFIVLVILFLKTITHLEKTALLPYFMTTTNISFLLSILAVSSVGIWLFIWHKTLFFGYYSWAFSIIGLSCTNLLQQYSQKLLSQRQQDKNIIEHLVEG